MELINPEGDITWYRLHQKKEGKGHKTSCVDGKTKETEKLVLVDRKQNRGHKHGHLIRLAYRFLDQLHFEKIFWGA